MDLGRIDSVDIRTQWKNEEYDFTPWLAQEAHIQILADAIGVDLEVQGTEVSIGNVPPAEFEAVYYANNEAPALMAGLT
jgi:hypothetical protein